MTNEEIIEAITATRRLIIIAPARAGYRVTIMRPPCGKVQHAQECATLTDCLTAIAKEMEIK